MLYTAASGLYTPTGECFEGEPNAALIVAAFASTKTATS